MSADITLFQYEVLQAIRGSGVKLGEDNVGLDNIYEEMGIRHPGWTKGLIPKLTLMGLGLDLIKLEEKGFVTSSTREVESKGKKSDRIFYKVTEDGWKIEIPLEGKGPLPRPTFGRRATSSFTGATP